jgi:two-component system, sensor histidine kinase PdtaS
VAVLGGGLVLVALALFGGLAYGRWQATVHEAEQLTENLSELLAEHAGRVFDASNLVADQAINLARDQEWNELAESREVFRHLLRVRGAFEYISAVWLADEAGMPRMTTRGFPAPPVSVADREHFQVQRGADVGPFISRLLRSRVTGETNIVMSRRIASERGDFRGVALVVIDPGYFQAFYQSIKGPYPISVDLFRSDRAVIIRHPEVAPEEALTLTKWPDRPGRLALGESGTIYRARSAHDGEERLESYERIKGFSFYVGVSIPRTAIFQRWLEGTMQQGIFAGAALAGLLLLVAVAISRTHREELARGELETLNRTLEERVRERTAEVERSAEGLRRLLAEKDVLLREVHHRVKNNLQIISSLLNLHSGKFAVGEVQRSFADCLNQVRAMGLVHELLYRSPNVAGIDFGEYLHVLASRFALFFGRGGQVRLDIRAAPLHFNLDTTIPLALIVTEAVTNAFKHAFPGNRTGTICVEVTQTGDVTTILVSDDGVGLPPGWEQLKTQSLGLKLLGVLAEQIDARLSFRSEGGTTVELVLGQASKEAKKALVGADSAAGA